MTNQICKSFRKAWSSFFVFFPVPYKMPNTFLAPLVLGSAQPGSKARCGWGSFAAMCLQPCLVRGQHSCSGASGPMALWSPFPPAAPTLVCATSVTLLLLCIAWPNEQALISQGIPLFLVWTVCFRRLSLTCSPQVHIMSTYFLELYFGLFLCVPAAKAVETEYSSSWG